VSCIKSSCPNSLRPPASGERERPAKREGEGKPATEEVESLAPCLASDLAHFIIGAMIEIDDGRQNRLRDRFRDR
jgi:hypothetical protein